MAHKISNTGEYTLTAKIEAIQRELNKRIQVYPALVSSGRMTQAESDYQIAIMKAIGMDYQALAPGTQITIL